MWYEQPRMRGYKTNTTNMLRSIKILNYQSMSDGELLDLADSFRNCDGLTVTDKKIPKVFALVNEAIIRSLNIEPSDQQILCGIYLVNTGIVQMISGEGKTLSAAFPAVWHALAGTRVHIITANDYLAFRDSDLLYHVYNLLGVTSGHIQAYMDDEERRRVYDKTIVYSGIRELGFDFIRDNLKYTIETKVQKSLGVAIIDEIDHTLIDESSTPMIISGNPIDWGGDITLVRDVVVEMIDLQQQICDDLARQVNHCDHASPDDVLVLAQLLVAAPQSQLLSHCLSIRPGIKKTLLQVAEEQYDVFSQNLFYIVDPDGRFVSLSDKGYDFLVGRLGPFYDNNEGHTQLDRLLEDPKLTLRECREERDLIRIRMNKSYSLGNQIYQSLRAFLLLRKDVDYFINEKSIVLIDKATGRPRPDCIYQHGLQGAIESKEGLLPKTDLETLGQISVAGLIGRYEKISGMTGTAITSARELSENYGLKVTVLPPSTRSKRIDHGYNIYSTKTEKLQAVLDSIVYAHNVGLPVLVGTSTLENSVELSKLLDKHSIRHDLLNASRDSMEVEIIQNAGRLGAVTIATDIAGRGTDIVLEQCLDNLVIGKYIVLIENILTERQGYLTLTCYSEIERDCIEERLHNCHKFNVSKCSRSNADALNISLIGLPSQSNNGITLDFYLGLQVIATELHTSPRVDMQLNGRSGRQGQYGHTYTVLSLEDHLVNTNVDIVSKLAQNYTADRRGISRFSGPSVNKVIRKIQDQTDREGEIHRALVHDFTYVLDLHTDMFYKLRDRIITDASIDVLIGDTISSSVESIVDQHFPTVEGLGYPDKFNNMCNELHLDYGVDGSCLFGADVRNLVPELVNMLNDKIDNIEIKIGTEKLTHLVKLVLLRTADELWTDHLEELRNLMHSNTLSNSYHKSMVAHYIQQAYQSWESLLIAVNSKSLSRVLTFPLEELDAGGSEKPIIYDETRVLIQQD